MNRKISIVTPSYNMLDYLEKCSKSIADQEINHEHIVIDGQSTDGTVEWLENQSNIISIIGKDNGMYDALNKGLSQANGDIIGHLNCDEQYLPGTLHLISDYFKENEDIDIIYGDFITINTDGEINSFKKSIPFRKYYVLNSNLYIGTCALFYRRNIFDNSNYFDINYKSSGDKEFLIRLHELGYKSLCINKLLSAFTVTGGNLSKQSNYKNEDTKIIEQYSKLPSFAATLMLFGKKIEKMIYGAYKKNRKVEYSIYIDKLSERKTFTSERVDYITKYN